jgi:hypothetical protein
MKIVRVTAVGLALAAGLMYGGSIAFSRWWLTDAQLHVWLQALAGLSGKLSVDTAAAGVPYVGLAAYLASCLAVGLFVAGTLYSGLEDLVLDILVSIAEGFGFLLAFAGSGIWALLKRMCRRGALS